MRICRCCTPNEIGRSGIRMIRTFGILVAAASEGCFFCSDLKLELEDDLRL